MSSNIDPTKPVAGVPTTQSVRDNFSAAKTEIEALQAADTAEASTRASADSALDSRVTALEEASVAAGGVSFTPAGTIAATDVQAAIEELDSETQTALGLKENSADTFQWLGFALSDESTAIVAGTAKLTVRLPACTLIGLPRASLTTASSSGAVTVDINEGGVSILGTKLSIDQGEKTSTTAATPATVTDSSIAEDAEITFDIDGAGANATGLKVYMKVHWN